MKMFSATWFAPVRFASVLLASILPIVVCAAGPEPLPSVAVPVDHPALFFSGRLVRDGNSQVTTGWSGARVCLRFKGTSVALRMRSDTPDNYVQAWVDGQPQPKIRLDSPGETYPIATGLAPGEHRVEVVRVTECFLGLTHFRGFVLDQAAVVLPWQHPHDRRILFIGDSITCGYGVEVDDPKQDFSPATENFCDSYTGLTVRALDADYLVVARSGIGIVRNYDGPFEGNADAMPAAYPHTFYNVDQPRWNPAQFVPHVICINLGTNDFSTKGVNQEKFVTTYIDFAGQLAAQHPAARLVLLQGPMDNREPLARAMTRVSDALAKKFPGRVTFFTLSHQGELGFGASSHPNRAQSRRNATELTGYLGKLMSWE